MQNRTVTSNLSWSQIGFPFSYHDRFGIIVIDKATDAITEIYVNAFRDFHCQCPQVPVGVKILQLVLLHLHFNIILARLDSNDFKVSFMNHCEKMQVSFIIGTSIYVRYIFESKSTACKKQGVQATFDSVSNSLKITTTFHFFSNKFIDQILPKLISKKYYLLRFTPISKIRFILRTHGKHLISFPIAKLRTRSHKADNLSRKGLGIDFEGPKSCHFRSRGMCSL